MKQLSIIVPMYNVEPFVEKCLRSIENQNVPKDDYEVICINDGSPDDSRGVVKRLQAEYKNIILIDQVNQGVSMARNNGIDIACGEYLMMVDPDDYLKPGYLKEKLKIVKQLNLDIGFTGYTILDCFSKEEYRYDLSYDQNNILTGIEFMDQYERGKSEIRDPHRSWAVFFKSDFLKSNVLKYLKGVPYLEDGEFMARVVCLAKRTSFLNDPFYMRTTQPGSATNNGLFNSEKARTGFFLAANNLLNFKNNYCKNEEQKVFMNQSIIHFTIIILISLNGFNYLKQYSRYNSMLKKGPLKKLDTKGCCGFYKNMGNSYNISINWFYINWLLLSFYKSLGIKMNKVFSVTK